MIDPHELERWRARHPEGTRDTGEVRLAPSEHDPLQRRVVPYCALLPEEAFPTEPFAEPTTDTGGTRYSPCQAISAVIASGTSGMRRKPTERDFFGGLKSADPTPIQVAAIDTWLSEATLPELVGCLAAGCYTARDLVRAIHRRGGMRGRFDAVRTLNRFCLPEWLEARRREDPWHDDR